MTTYCFSVTAEADPSALPRVLGAVALTGLTPASLLSRAFERELSVDLQLSGIGQAEADNLAKRLERVHCVTSVLFHAKRRLTAVA